MALITRKPAAERLLGCLQHEISLADLVAWAESAMIEDDIRGVRPDTCYNHLRYRGPNRRRRRACLRTHTGRLRATPRTTQLLRSD